MAAAPDFWRQLGFFDPHSFDKEVHIVGVGATGSHIAHTLACMGIQKMTVYDFDVVESHNLPNQIYRMKDVGKLKVDALKEIIQEKMGIEIKTVPKKVEKATFGGYVFMCIDSMDSARGIITTSIFNKPSVELMIETRMGLVEGRIYCVDPLNKIHIDKWKQSWYPDSEAAESPCNLRAIAATAEQLAARACLRVAFQVGIERAAGTVATGLFAHILTGGEAWNEALVGINGSTPLLQFWDDLKEMENKV